MYLRDESHRQVKKIKIVLRHKNVFTGFLTIQKTKQNYFVQLVDNFELGFLVLIDLFYEAAI